MRNHAQKFFAPKPRRSWGKLIWSVAADLTLDTAGAPGVPFLVTFPISKLHRNNNSGDHCDCGSFFSTFLFGRAWRCENGETITVFLMKLIVLVGWRDTEIERVLMGVSQQNRRWKECGKDSLATELDRHDSVSYGTFDQVRGCWWKKHSNSMDVYNLSY